MKPRLLIISAMVSAVALTTSVIAARSSEHRLPSLELPRGSVTNAADTFASVTAAPDFATTVFSDPWDYSNAEDIHFEEPPQGNSALWNGIFGYDAASTYPWFDPLPYFPGSLPQERDGVTHPINANFYNQVAFFMYSSNSGTGGINWNDCDWSKNSACSGQMSFHTVAGWHLYILTPKSDQPTMPAAWSGNVIGLRIIPIAAQPGTHIVVDWLRAYHAGSPRVTFDVPVAAPGQRVTLVLRCNGPQPMTLPIEQLSTTGPTAAVSFDYSPFPPGSYQLYTTANGRDSAASSVLNITSPPTTVVDWPNAEGAGDLAAQTIGHPWDFSSMASVGAHANMTGLQMLPGGVLRGQNAGPEINNPYFYLPLAQGFSGNNWHRVTIRVKYDGPFGVTGGPTGGAVGRLIWYDASDLQRDDQNILPIILYNGWNTITTDLMTNPPTAIVDPTQQAARIGWAGQTINQVRWDPNEDDSARVWYVDSIRIAGDPVSYGGADISFHDSTFTPGETTTAYLTTSRAGSDNVGSSYTVAVKPGENTLHVFSLHGLGGRECWVRIVTTSPTGATSTQWSSGPIRIVS